MLFFCIIYVYVYAKIYDEYPWGGVFMNDLASLYNDLGKRQRMKSKSEIIEVLNLEGDTDNITWQMIWEKMQDLSELEPFVGAAKWWTQHALQSPNTVSKNEDKQNAEEKLLIFQSELVYFLFKNLILSKDAPKEVILVTDYSPCDEILRRAEFESGIKGVRFPIKTAMHVYKDHFDDPDKKQEIDDGSR